MMKKKAHTKWLAALFAGAIKISYGYPGPLMLKFMKKIDLRLNGI